MKEGRSIGQRENITEDLLIVKGWFAVDLPDRLYQHGIPKEVARAIENRIGPRAIGGGIWEFDQRMWFKRRADAVWYLLLEHEIWAGVDDS